MSLRIKYGLGWQPDLPDMRDKTFATAQENLRKAEDSTLEGASLPKAEVAKRKGKFALGKPRPGKADVVAARELHTFDGWAESRAASEQSLLIPAPRAKIEQPAWASVLKKAFGAKTPWRPALLEKPPQQPLEAVDLRLLQSPIEDQGALGSCTAHAVIGLVEYLQIATSGRYVDASRLFLYKATRDLLKWNGDKGAYIRETIKALRVCGVCPEAYWEYDQARFDEFPTAFCYAFASNYKALRYYRLLSLHEIKLSLSQGYPVAFGFTCFESLFSKGTQITGRIPIPSPGEKVKGGHAVLAVGYRERTSNGKLKDDECPPGHVIIRNSWGNDWGLKGYGFLPFEFFEGLAPNHLPVADDFWTMTQMEIPDLDMASTAPFILGEGNPVFGADQGNGPMAVLGDEGNPVFG